MKAKLSLLFFLTSVVALASEDPVVMAPFRVRPSDLLFKIGYLVETDAVTEIRVTQVVPGSAAERVGIRKGDCFTSIRGVPVVGKTPETFSARTDASPPLRLLTFDDRAVSSGATGHSPLNRRSSVIRNSPTTRRVEALPAPEEVF